MPRPWSSGCSPPSPSRWWSSGSTFRACARRSTWSVACNCCRRTRSEAGARLDLTVVSARELPLRSGEDVVRLRQAVRERAIAVGLSLVDQTKIVTAASELGRNTVQYGGGGTVRIETVANGTRRGLRLEFIDQGP